MKLKLSDPNAASILTESVGLVEIVGEDDTVIGTYTPTLRPGRRFPEFGVTDEEMLRRLNDPTTASVSGEEVMARLRSLRKA